MLLRQVCISQNKQNPSPQTVHSSSFALCLLHVHPQREFSGGPLNVNTHRKSLKCFYQTSAQYEYTLAFPIFFNQVRNFSILDRKPCRENFTNDLPHKRVLHNHRKKQLQEHLKCNSFIMKGNHMDIVDSLGRRVLTMDLPCADISRQF